MYICMVGADIVTEVTTTSRRRACTYVCAQMYVRVCTCAHVSSLNGITCTEHSLLHVCVCLCPCVCVCVCIMYRPLAILCPCLYIYTRMFSWYVTFTTLTHPNFRRVLLFCLRAPGGGIRQSTLGCVIVIRREPGRGFRVPPPLPGVCRDNLPLLSLRNTGPRARGTQCLLLRRRSASENMFPAARHVC